MSQVSICSSTSTCSPQSCCQSLRIFAHMPQQLLVTLGFSWDHVSKHAGAKGFGHVDHLPKALAPGRGRSLDYQLQGESMSKFIASFRVMILSKAVRALMILFSFRAAAVGCRKASKQPMAAALKEFAVLEDCHARVCTWRSTNANAGRSTLQGTEKRHSKQPFAHLSCGVLVKNLQACRSLNRLKWPDFYKQLCDCSELPKSGTYARTNC